MIYKNDMLIMANDTGVSSNDVCYSIASIVLMIVFYAVFPFSHFYMRDYRYLWFLALVYFIYFIMYISVKQSTDEYISNMKPLTDIFNHVQKCIDAPPTIIFYVQSYHYKIVVDPVLDKKT